MTIPLARILYVALLVVAAVFLWHSVSFPGAQSDRDIGPATFPQWVAVSMIVLILADLVLSRRRTPYLPVADLGIAAVVAVLVGGTIWAATLVGFFVALPPALFVGLRLAGSRSLVANGAYSIVFPAALWLIFGYLLQLPITSF